MHGPGLSNEMYHQLQPQETKSKVALAVTEYNSKRQYKRCNKTQCSSIIAKSFLSNKKDTWKVVEFCELDKKVAKI